MNGFTFLLFITLTTSILADSITNQYVFKRKSTKSIEVQRKLNGFENNRKIKLHKKDAFLSKIGLETITIVDTNVLKTLELDPDIEFIEKDGPFEHCDFIPNDALFTNQWHLEKTHVPYVWDFGKGDSNIIIAILDGGVYNKNPDLINKMLPGFNAYSNTTVGNGWGTSGHATMCAGLAGASGNNKIGVASPAYESKLMSIIVTDLNGYGYASLMGRGIIWAADHGVKICSLSFKVSNVTTVRSSAKYFRDRGGLVFIASGNNGELSTAPDDIPVITVMATDQNDKRAGFSTYGPLCDIAAPGVAMWSTTGSGYSSGSGTSYACPTAAGICALLWSLKPTMTNNEMELLLENSAVKCGYMTGTTNYILRIDAKNAYQSMMSVQIPAKVNTLRIK